MKKSKHRKSKPPQPQAKSKAAGTDRLLPLDFLQAATDEQENLLALERLLTRAQGFTLAFARVNMPSRRAGLIAEMRRRLARKGIDVVEIEFSEPISDLLAELQRRLARQYRRKKPAKTHQAAVAEDESRFAVFAYGLENSISSAAASHPFLRVMNYKRENFREQLPAPLVLWVPEFVLQAIIEGAPDFWAWRSGVYEFAAPAGELEKMWRQIEAERGNIELSRLPAEEKRARLRQVSSLLAEYEAHDQAATPELLAIRADLLNRLGMLQRYLGDLAEALACFEKSLALRRQLGDRAGEGTTLNNIGQIYDARGDYAAALRYLEQSLNIRRAIDDRAGEAATLNNISQIYDARGDYGAALRYLEQSLNIQQEIGDRKGEGTTLNNLATTAYARGDHAAALRYLEQSLKITQEIGDRAGEGTTLNNMAGIAHARGDYAAALRYLEQSLKLQQEIGVRAGEGTTLNNISQIYSARGDYAAALRTLEQSLKIRQEIGDRAGMIPTLHNMAYIHLQNNDPQAALEKFVEALQLAQDTKDAMGLYNVYRDLGNLLCRAGEIAQGLPLLEQALAVGRASSFPGVEQVEALLQKWRGA